MCFRFYFVLFVYTHISLVYYPKCNKKSSKSTCMYVYVCTTAKTTLECFTNVLCMLLCLLFSLAGSPYVTLVRAHDIVTVFVILVHAYSACVSQTL